MWLIFNQVSLNVKHFVPHVIISKFYYFDIQVLGITVKRTCGAGLYGGSKQ
jgi:hypothetical protein